ncbi:hypothetical protein ABZZ79_02870 [Streptomyces sp. NPDC006458]|uniref:hypothetical protein n=1 Tax=Streptomyces sp. NPDC006458 TaxID=3154302 RepID=UPI0033ACE4B0
MTAYSTAYEALTSGRPLRPGEASQLLAALREEFGTELADAVEKQLDGQYRRTEADTNGTFRKKRVTYGASMRIVAAFRHLAAAPYRPIIPNPRDNRSTS